MMQTVSWQSLIRHFRRIRISSKKAAIRKLHRTCVHANAAETCCSHGRSDHQHACATFIILNSLPLRDTKSCTAYSNVVEPPISMLVSCFYSFVDYRVLLVVYGFNGNQVRRCVGNNAFKKERRRQEGGYSLTSLLPRILLYIRCGHQSLFLLC